MKEFQNRRKHGDMIRRSGHITLDRCKVKTEGISEFTQDIKQPHAFRRTCFCSCFEAQESGTDSKELPAPQVLGHGLWLVPCGLCRSSQRDRFQELEPLRLPRDREHVRNGLQVRGLPPRGIRFRDWDVKRKKQLLFEIAFLP